MIKVEIALERTELTDFGNASEGIFRSNLRQLQCRLQHAVEARARKVTGVGAGSALAEEHAHANGPRPGFFQSLHLAKANDRRELVALTDNGFRRGGATSHRSPNHVLCKLFQIGFEFGVSSFELCCFSLDF